MEACRILIWKRVVKVLLLINSSLSVGVRMLVNSYENLSISVWTVWIYLEAIHACWWIVESILSCLACLFVNLYPHNYHNLTDQSQSWLHAHGVLHNFHIECTIGRKVGAWFFVFILWSLVIFLFPMSLLVEGLGPYTNILLV